MDPDHPCDPANDPMPTRHEFEKVPEGVHVPMCLCGTLCKFRVAQDASWTYGRRFFMCNNLEYDQPPNSSEVSSIALRTPPFIP